MKTETYFKGEIIKLRDEIIEAKKQLSNDSKMDEKRAKQLRGTVKRNS